MIKFFTRGFVALTLGMAIAPAGAEEGLLLASSGTSRLPISVSPKVQTHLRTKKLAENMAATLQTISGATFAIQSGTNRVEDGAVFLALSEEFPEVAGALGLSGKGRDAVGILTRGNALYILGNSEAAVSNGAYSVLRDLGCRWYFPGEDWRHLPRIPELRYEANRVEEPSFRFARLFPGIGRPGTMDRWNAENRMLRSYAGNIQHTLGVRDTLFAEHPEYFALRGGKRTKKQLCIGNSEARSLFVENALATLRKGPPRRIVSVEPPDNLAHCQAPETLALGNGTPSDAVFFLANETAKAAAKEFPEALVGLYAYLDHADPPSFKLEPNIYVEVTTNLRRTKLSVDEAVREFQARGAIVGIRDYLSVPQWHHGRIGGGSKGSNFVETPAAIAALGKLGVVGYNGEMSENWAPNGLTYYLVAQVLWNSEFDIAGETDLFFQSMFGKAAPIVREMYERWRERSLSQIELVGDSARRLRQAYAATDDPAVLRRLDQLAMAVYWNFLFHQLAKAAADPAAITLAHDGLLRTFSAWSARIDSTGMLDTYALSRMVIRLGGLKRLKAAGEHLGENLDTYLNGLNGKWWVADKKLGVPDAATVRAKLDEIDEALAPYDLPRHLSKPPLPKDLIPIAAFDARAEMPSLRTNAPRTTVAVPANTPLVLWAKQGETVRIPLAAAPDDLKEPLAVECVVVPYKNRSKILKNQTLKLTIETGASRENIRPESVPFLEFTAASTGAHVLTFKSRAPKLSVLLDDDLRHRPLALAPFLDVAGETMKERFSRTQKENLPYYFYWPARNTQTLLVGAGPKGPLQIQSSSELLVDIPEFGGEQLRLLSLPANRLNRVMEIASGDNSFAMRGFPLLLSPSPLQALVPLE